jgi:glycosyltransferase involved in cell wall biosynthesis
LTAEDGPLRLGFACHWSRSPQETWSGTAWQLRGALTRQADVELSSIEPQLQKQLRRAVRLATLRRRDGAWTSPWLYSRATAYEIERQVRRAARRRDLDAIVQIGDLATTTTPYAIVQDLSYQLLLEVFGPDGVPHFRNLTHNQIRRLRDRQERIFSRAAVLLPMSRWLAESQIAHGVPAERVRVVNPGINVPLTHEPLPERRRGRVRRLLFVGRDFDTKAGDQVVAAVALLRAGLDSEVTLTVAGPPAWPLAGPIPDAVDFRGPVPASEIQSLYDSHDLFVMPSRFEGFGIVFVEALVRGLPCIGRAACAMPEIIEPGSGGYLVTTEDPHELAEAISRTLSDDDLYRRCAEQAPRRRSRYTWDRAAHEVLDAVRQVV